MKTLLMLGLLSASFAVDSSKLTSDDFIGYEDFVLVPEVLDEERIKYIAPNSLDGGRVFFLTQNENSFRRFWSLSANSEYPQNLSYDPLWGKIYERYAGTMVQLGDGSVIYDRYNKEHGGLEICTISKDGLVNKVIAPKRRDAYGFRGIVSHAPMLLVDGRVVFISNYSNDPTGTREGVRENLWIMDVDGKNVSQLTHFDSIPLKFGYFQIKNVSQLKDERLVFIASYDGKSEIWIMDLDGRNREVLSRHLQGKKHIVNAANVIQISDGRLIASIDRTTQNNFELWAMNLNGSQLENLTSYKSTRSEGYFADTQPVELSDGRILFATNRSKLNTSEFWVLNVESKMAYPLTHYSGGVFTSAKYLNIGNYTDVSLQGIEDIEKFLPPLQAKFVEKIKADNPDALLYKEYQYSGSGFELLAFLESIQKESLSQASRILALDILLAATNSRVIEEEIIPQFIDSYLVKLQESGINSFSDLEQGSLYQVKLFSWGLEALSELGQVSDVASLRSVKKILAKYLAQTALDNNHLKNLALELEQHGAFLATLATDKSAKSIGLILLTIKNFWMNLVL